MLFSQKENTLQNQKTAFGIKLGTVPLHTSFIEATQTGTAQSNLFDLHRPLFSS